MKQFYNVIVAESLKLRRTLALWLVTVVPIFIVFLVSLLIPALEIYNEMTNLWFIFSNLAISIYFIIFPVFIILIMALLNSYEHVSSSRKHMFALPVPRWQHYFAKIVMGHILIITSCFAVVIAIPIAGFFLNTFFPALLFEDSIPWVDNIRSILFFYLGGWFLISIFMFLFWIWKNQFAIIMIGIVALIDGFVTNALDRGFYHPWVLVPTGDENNMYLGILFRVVSGLFVLIAGCFIATRLDVKE